MRESVNFFLAGRGFQEGFVVEMRKVAKKWNPPKTEVAKTLFSFLAELSTHSEDTSMDAYNIAICFGPNLCPIPDGHDLVQYTSHVNSLIKNFIIFSEEIFANPDPSGPYGPGFVLPDVVAGGRPS